MISPSKYHFSEKKRPRKSFLAHGTSPVPLHSDKTLRTTQMTQQILMFFQVWALKGQGLPASKVDFLEPPTPHGLQNVTFLFSVFYSFALLLCVSYLIRTPIP